MHVLKNIIGWQKNDHYLAYYNCWPFLHYCICIIYLWFWYWSDNFWLVIVPPCHNFVIHSCNIETEYTTTRLLSHPTWIEHELLLFSCVCYNVIKRDLIKVKLCCSSKKLCWPDLDGLGQTASKCQPLFGVTKQVAKYLACLVSTTNYYI